MNVRWVAVFYGWLVDFGLSLMLQSAIILFGVEGFFERPSLTNPLHLLLLLLFVLVVGAGGFVAARTAGASFALHGFLVGVADIIVSTLLGGGAAMPWPFILVEILGCGAGALCGLLAMRLRRA